MTYVDAALGGAIRSNLSKRCGGMDVMKYLLQTFSSRQPLISSSNRNKWGARYGLLASPGADHLAAGETSRHLATSHCLSHSQIQGLPSCKSTNKRTHAKQSRNRVHPLTSPSYQGAPIKANRPEPAGEPRPLGTEPRVYIYPPAKATRRVKAC